MSNQFVDDLLNQASERFSIDSLSMSTTDWVCKNTTLKNRPFSLKDYEFQKKILDDWHPNMDVIKISQIGLTEIMIRKALSFLVRNNGTSLIFSLPTEEMYKRTSNSRVKPLVQKEKVFNTSADRANKAVRSMDMMQFGQSFLYLVPAIETAATSINADVVFNDELDLSDQKMISLFSSRLQGSKHRIGQRFSTPSFPSYGTDLNWQTSDQHMYFSRCHSCGHYNHPEFTRDFINIPGMPDDMEDLTMLTVDFQDQIDLGSSYVMCEKCHNPLDLGNPDLREWVVKHPSRVNSRGYRISPFATDTLDLPYIFQALWRYQKTEYVRGFHNTVLGLPYTDGSIQIPESDIRACMTENVVRPELSAFNDLWVGIDVGQTCHVVIGAGVVNPDIVAIYQVHIDDLVEHCKDLCEKYNVRGGAIDRHPYEPTSRAVFAASKGVILPVEYRGSKDINIVLDDYDDVHHGQVDRTTFLDALATRIRKREMKISGYGHFRQALIEHLRDMVRDETPDKPAVWTKLNGNDHFFHAAAFMNVAPKIAPLIRLKSKAEVRTMALGSFVDVKDTTSNIIGVSNKRFDPNILKR